MTNTFHGRFKEIEHNDSNGHRHQKEHLQGWSYGPWYRTTSYFEVRQQGYAQESILMVSELSEYLSSRRIWVEVYGYTILHD